jgi:hypothetical protein
MTNVMIDSPAPLAQHDVTINQWNLIQAIAPAMHASRLFGVASPEQAMAIMLKGVELGLSLTASFEFLDLIQGKVALKPQGALALIHRSRNFDITITDGPDSCTVWMRRRDTGFEYTTQFGRKDAEQAGLIKKDGAYDKYASDMYRARAIARCSRVVAPDVIAGLYLTDELNPSVASNGHVREVTSD